MNSIASMKNALLHLFYPHVCAGCGSDALPRDSQLCFLCLQELPVTGFERHCNNPVEKIFSGRLQFEAATAFCYFSKQAALQHILHQFKYGGNRALGRQLGIAFGQAVKNRIVSTPLMPLCLCRYTASVSAKEAITRRLCLPKVSLK